MLLHMQRFIILVVPNVFCIALAALLIWEDNVKKHLPRLLIFTFLSSLTQAATYLIHQESIRYPLEIASGFIWLYLIFRQSLGWIFKIYTSSIIIAFIHAPITLVITRKAQSLMLASLAASRQPGVYLRGRLLDHLPPGGAASLEPC